MVISTVFKTHGSVREFVCQFVSHLRLFFCQAAAAFLPISFEIREAFSPFPDCLPLSNSPSPIVSSTIDNISRVENIRLFPSVLFFGAGKRYFLACFQCYTFSHLWLVFHATTSRISIPDRSSASLRAGIPSLSLTMACFVLTPVL